MSSSGAYYPPTDPAANVPGLRTLGAGTQQAAPGNSLQTSRVIAAMQGLRKNLNLGTRSAAIGLIGDSTGNDTFEWFYTLGQDIAAEYPAYTVDYMLWDDTTQRFGTPSRWQTGANGELYADLSSGTLSRRLPVGATPALTGVIDVRVKVTAADWTPASTVYLASKDNGGGQRSWWFYLAGGSGNIAWTYSTDGTAQTTITPGATGIADGSTAWVRVLFTPDDGSGNHVTKFYTGTDGVTWTQIGTTSTVAGAVTLNDATNAPYWLGGIASASTATATKIHEIQIRNGDTGPIVAPTKPDLWSSYGAAGAVTCAGSPVLTLVNGSRPGADITYLGDATRLPKLTPDYGQLLTFLSDSHNETRSQGKYWTSVYRTWVANVQAQVSGALVGVTQNPETSSATYHVEHSSRRADLLAMGAVPVIDTYQAFVDYGAAWIGDLMADSVHPNATGSTLWKNTIKAVWDLV